MLFLGFPQFYSSSLVKFTAVVTAAHCVYDVINIKSVTVTAGHIKSGFNWNPETEKHYQSRRAAKIIVHSGFDLSNVENDIAIILLDSPFDNTRWISPAYLPSPKLSLVVGDSVLITGWGEKRNGNQPTLLQAARITIAAHKQCNDAYADYYGVEFSMD